MPSIINGLFSARSGISSHGQAIAIIGDNISNSSTIGYKASRAEFQDLVAGGQASGQVVGAGSQNAGVNTIMSQGTLEFTGRTLDLSVDGNGFFAVQNNTGKYYTRAGDFKLDTSGNIINQNGLQVLGYPAGGSGSLQPINVNTISQSSVGTQTVTVTGNLNAGAAVSSSVPLAPLAGAGANSTTVTYADINSAAAFTTTVDVFDSLGASHTVTVGFYKTATNVFSARAYVNSQDLGETVSGYPRQLAVQPANTAASGTFALNFNSSGALVSGTSTSSLNLQLPAAWNSGASASRMTFDLSGFTQYASPAAVKSITQDGQGVGNVTSLSIEKDGQIFARLSNGQSATVGRLGLVNFANPEGLTRVGGNLLQQSPSSGEPLAGRAQSGTFGAISSGSVELSTVDIANEFVKMITLQRGFQANSRIITTINQLLNDIIQLV